MSCDVKTCGACELWIEIPLEGEGGERIGVCQCAWRIDLVDNTPLFEGICYGDTDTCEHWTPAREGDLVRCESCVNWGAMSDFYPPDYCPVVRKCTRPSDWCCWGARDEREEAR